MVLPILAHLLRLFATKANEMVSLCSDEVESIVFQSKDKLKLTRNVAQTFQYFFPTFT